MIFELFRKAWVEAKGTTLSLRMFEGKPRSLKSLSNSVKASKQLTVVTQNYPIKRILLQRTSRAASPLPFGGLLRARTGPRSP
jgi:hypothetical protein